MSLAINGGDSVVSHAQVISLLNRIAGAGFDFIKTEGLYTFDGERGFSLDQENKMAKKHGDKNKGQNNAELARRGDHGASQIGTRCAATKRWKNLASLTSVA